MQYTAHYNLNLPEGSDIVNPLIQDNPNYTAIDNALYANKLRVIGNATHTKTGTTHTITRSDTDIPALSFVATGDYNTGDTFTVDGVSVTARIANGSTIPNGAFKINSSVLAILNGTILNLINIEGVSQASDVSYVNTISGLAASDVQDAIDELAELGDDSGWNVTANGTSYRKIGHTVTININRSTDYATGWSVFDTIPNDFRPSIIIYGSVVYENSGGNFNSHLLQLNTSGELAIYSGGITNKRIYGSLTYLV